MGFMSLQPQLVKGELSLGQGANCCLFRTGASCQLVLASQQMNPPCHLTCSLRCEGGQGGRFDGPVTCRTGVSVTREAEGILALYSALRRVSREQSLTLKYRS